MLPWGDFYPWKNPLKVTLRWFDPPASKLQWAFSEIPLLLRFTKFDHFYLDIINQNMKNRLNVTLRWFFFFDYKITSMSHVLNMMTTENDSKITF